MKSLLLTLLFVTGSAQAFTLDYRPNADKSSFSDASNVADAGFEKNWSGICVDRSTQTQYTMELTGYGLVAHYSMKQGFLLQCPGLRSSPTGTYKGGDLTASLLIGGFSAGVFVKDDNAAVCAMAGAQLVALGAQFTGTTIVVK